MYLYIPERSAGHIQSVVVGGVCVTIAFLMFALGVIGDLLAVNRAMHDEILTKLRDLESRQGIEPNSLEQKSEKRKTA